MNYIFDATTKLEYITVRVWDRSSPDKPMSGHYSFNFTYDEARNIHEAIELASSALESQLSG